MAFVVRLEDEPVALSPRFHGRGMPNITLAGGKTKTNNYTSAAYQRIFIERCFVLIPILNEVQIIYNFEPAIWELTEY